jgi:hypothetical protein
MRQLLLPLACAFVIFCSLLHAQNAKRLWVLGENGEIVEYDPFTFAAKQTVKAPPQISKNPQPLHINRKGQMLIAPDPKNIEATAALSEAKLWFWNGEKALSLDRGVTRKSTPAGSNLSVTESVPYPALSADGEHLFWFANQTTKLKKEDLDLSVNTTFRAWQTDLAGAQREELATFAFPKCGCETGVCSETCPEASFWFPDDGVDSFFITTHWIQGQTDTQYLASFLNQKVAGKWSPKKLSPPVERILDATENGETLIESIPDAGCCGWDNESDDQTILSRNAKSVVLFDERGRYNNPNYDVSFFTSRALLSHDLGSVAMTIACSAQPGQDIRLADEGQPNPDELARIRKAIADLPAVEVVSATDTTKRIAFIPHATLVGWLNDKEILIVEAHLLVAYEAATGTRRKSGVKVPDETFVLLR